MFGENGNYKMKDLDLRENQIGDDAADVIIEILKTNKSLHSILLKGNMISQNKMNKINELLLSNRNNKTIYKNYENDYNKLQMDYNQLKMEMDSLKQNKPIVMKSEPVENSIEYKRLKIDNDRLKDLLNQKEEIWKSEKDRLENDYKQLNDDFYKLQSENDETNQQLNKLKPEIDHYQSLNEQLTKEKEKYINNVYKLFIINSIKKLYQRMKE